MNWLSGMSKSATVVIIMILTSFFASGILTLTFMFNPNFLFALYEMGLWGMVYTFMGVWLLSTCLVVLILWLVLRKRITVGDVLTS